MILRLACICGLLGTFSCASGSEHTPVWPSVIDYLCSLPPDQGPCGNFSTFYYYDQAKAVCMQFIYGGCGGNQNRFPDGESCYKSCSGSQYQEALASERVQDNPFTDEVCSEPPKYYQCVGSKLERRFFFNPAKQHCESFLWNGCSYSRNNFRSKDECSKYCQSGLVEAAAQRSVEVYDYYDIYEYRSSDDYQLAELTTTSRPTTTTAVTRAPRAAVTVDSPRWMKRILPKRCLLKVVTVDFDCDSRHWISGRYPYRFYFDSHFAVCRLFSPVGCVDDADQSQNRFATLQDCRQLCESLATPSYIQSQQSATVTATSTTTEAPTTTTPTTTTTTTTTTTMPRQPALRRLSRWKSLMVPDRRVEEIFQPAPSFVRCEPSQILRSLGGMNFARCRDSCKWNVACRGFTYDDNGDVCHLVTERCQASHHQTPGLYHYEKRGFSSVWPMP